jgi:cell division protein FtsZ
MAAKSENAQDDVRELRCRVLVAGVGGAAGNVLGHALADWPEPPTVAAVNTDVRALEATAVALKVAIGRTVAKGMGTGGDAELGRLAANEDLDALRALVAGHDLLLLVAGLGGGTATGAAPVLARIAREEGLLVLAYVTLPFAFEGARRQEQAQEGLADLKQSADAVIGLPNQRLHALLPSDTSLPDAFAFVDRMMSAGIRGLWTLLARDNMLNLDFSDLQSLVENSGNECGFGYGEGQGPGKAEQALQGLLEGPMLEKGRVIANSGAMILNVAGGPDLSLAELETIHRRFQEAARPGARISLGAAVLAGWTGRLALTVLAAEHWLPPARPGSLVIPAGPDVPADVPAGRARKNVQQSELQLGGAGDRGRFRDVAPTIHEGADLDIPVYIRRGIRIPS